MSFLTPYDFGKQHQSITRLRKENTENFRKYRKYKRMYEDSQSQIRSFKKTSKLSGVLARMNDLKRENHRLREKLSLMEHQKYLYERFHQHKEYETVVKPKMSKSIVEDSKSDIDGEIQFSEIPDTESSEEEEEDGRKKTLPRSLKASLESTSKRLRHFKQQFQTNLEYLEEELKLERQKNARLERKNAHYREHLKVLQDKLDELEAKLEVSEETQVELTEELNESKTNVDELLEEMKHKDSKILTLSTHKILSQSLNLGLSDSINSSKLHQSMFFPTSENDGEGEDDIVRFEDTLSTTSSTSHDTKNNFPVHYHEEQEIFSQDTLVGSDHKSAEKLMEYIISNEDISSTHSFTICTDDKSVGRVRNRKFTNFLYFVSSAKDGLRNSARFNSLRKKCRRVCIIGIQELCPDRFQILKMFAHNGLFFGTEDQVVKFDNVKSSTRNRMAMIKLLGFLRLK